MFSLISKQKHFLTTFNPFYWVSQVTPCDQVITEGQDVVISAKVGGQPKPMVYW